MSSEPNERLSDEDAKLLKEAIADVEREEADTPTSNARTEESANTNENTQP